MYAEFNFCQSYNIIIFLLAHDWDSKWTYNLFFSSSWKYKKNLNKLAGHARGEQGN